MSESSRKKCDDLTMPVSWSFYIIILTFKINLKKNGLGIICPKSTLLVPIKREENFLSSRTKWLLGK